MSEKTIVSSNGYYQKLLDVIPHLNEYRSSSGGEGVAYFLDDKFVVKEYVESDDWEMFDHVFELYCTEMQRFAEMGLNVPKIYAWIKIPNMNHYTKGHKNKYRYYVLEEKAKGRNLYYGFLEEFYPECVTKFDYKIYLDIVRNPNYYPYEFDEIVKTYLQDYIQMNEYLESVSEKELADMIVSAYKMYKMSKHSEPDMYPCNLFVDDKFTLIDSRIYTDSSERLMSESEKDNQFIRNLMNLFLYNENVQDLENVICYYQDKSERKDYSEYKAKNKKAAKAVIERVVDLMNKYCDNPVITDPNTYLFAFTTIKSFLGVEDAAKALSGIHTTFEK